MFEEIEDNVSLAHKTENTLIFNTPNSKRLKELDGSASCREGAKGKSEESVNSCDIDLGESSNESIFSGVGQEINQIKKPQSIRLKESQISAEAPTKRHLQHQTINEKQCIEKYNA